jgi:hypothetical protein
VERNRKAGRNPPRVVAPTEEEEEDDIQLIQKNKVFWLHSSRISLCTAVPTFRTALLPPFARQDEGTFDWNVDANVPNYTVPYPSLHSSSSNSTLTLYVRPR